MLQIPPTPPDKKDPGKREFPGVFNGFWGFESCQKVVQIGPDRSVLYHFSTQCGTHWRSIVEMLFQTVDPLLQDRHTASKVVMLPDLSGQLVQLCVCDDLGKLELCGYFISCLFCGGPCGDADPGQRHQAGDDGNNNIAHFNHFPSACPAPTGRPGEASRRHRRGSRARWEKTWWAKCRRRSCSRRPI